MLPAFRRPRRREDRPENAITTPASRAPLWLLVLVTLSGTMAMHIFVPALPLAGHALHASAASMQQTITLYVVGLAIGQLLYGPVSDAWGRRPTLLLGLSIYFTASVLALVAPTVQWLVGARLLQALGGASGIILGRAIVRDMAEPGRATKDLALLNLLTMVGPGLAPIVGGYLADHFGWRAVYVFLVLMGTAMVAFTWRLLPETHRERRPLRAGLVLRDYAHLWSHARFVGYMLGGASLTTAFYPYLAAVAYIVHIELDLPIRDIGWFAAATIVGASLGTLTTRRMAGRWSSTRLLFLGAGVAWAMTLMLLLCAVTETLTPLTLLGITVTMTFGSGMASPAALGSSLAVVPRLTGAAAGVYGSGQMAMGAFGTWLVGLGDEPLLACAFTQIGLTTLALASFAWAVSRQPPVAVRRDPT